MTIATRVATAIIDQAPLDDVATESDSWAGRGGTSAEVWHLGLRPAFRNRLTGEVFYDPDNYVHLSTTVPRELWAEVDKDGDLKRFKPGIEQGFVFPDDPDRFLSRAEAAQMVVAEAALAVTASVFSDRRGFLRPHPISRG